ncbi:MAG: beta-propeller domain-containing protein [Propionibacteriales bacterium]|nr:beta-propeller domain-containing protein [Propionibacteriales bacterium]
MTDLENLWDDYPTGKAPTGKILAAATKDQQHRRRIVVRPLLTAAAVTGLAGAFLTGTLVNDGSGGGGTPPGTEALPSHVAFQADLPAAKDCDELLESYIDRALDLVGPYGWGGGPYWYADGFSELDGRLGRDVASDQVGPTAANGRAAYKSARTPQTDRQVNSETGTNVQEAAVDEPDTAKTNGEILALVRDDALFVYDVTGSSTEKLGRIGLPGVEDAEIMLSGDTVVVVGADDEAPAEERPSDHYGYGYVQPAGTRVLTVSLEDPAKPEITQDVTYDAATTSVRQHGSTIRLVLSSGLPDLDFVEPNGKRSEDAALKRNRKLVEDSTIEDWLPTITADDGDDAKGQQLLDCTNVAIPSDELALDTTSVVGFDAESPDKVDAIGLAGQTGIAYESADHLYLATSSGWGGGMARCIDWCDTPALGTSNGSSYLFDFELDGTQATHVASGEVEGAIRDRWSIDEADGVLRVAVGPTQETGNFNSIVTFERDGEDLVELGRLDKLGRNEDIQSVRWFDDLVIMVTFRQVDPLYAVDLTDTAKPKLLGKLKIPGFSSYLHPLGDMRMIGVGEGPDGKGGWGAQIGLFNVTDVTDVKRLDVHNYGSNTQALAGADPRAFTWLPDHRTVLTVIEKYTSRRVGYVSVLKLKDGKLLERLQRVEYGDDVDDVRALPMPDGRVVLVTGEDAQFFEL